VQSPGWRRLWDACLFVGSAAPALLFGVAFANIFQGVPIDQKGIFQGNLFTLIKSEGALRERAAATAGRLWPIEVGVAVVFLGFGIFTTRLYDNYLAHPLLFAVILLTVAALFGIRVFLAKGALFTAWVSSAVTIVGATFYGVIGLFPNMFPSSLDAAYSLTAHNSASSQLTLTIMLIVVAIFVPIVLAYQAWAYRLFNTPVRTEDLIY